MRKVDLRALGRKLRGADFSAADFSGMDLRGLDFTDAILSGANLDLTVSDRTTSFKKASLTSLSEPDMKRLGLKPINWWGKLNTRMTNGSHIGTRFDHAHANDLILDGSNISYAKVVHVNIAGASLKGTICHGTDFMDTYTCLVNGLGEIGPRLKPSSSEMEGAIVNQETIFDPKPYRSKAGASRDGSVTVGGRGMAITFAPGGGGVTEF